MYSSNDPCHGMPPVPYQGTSRREKTAQKSNMKTDYSLSGSKKHQMSEPEVSTLVPFHSGTMDSSNCQNPLDNGISGYNMPATPHPLSHTKPTFQALNEAMPINENEGLRPHSLSTRQKQARSTSHPQIPAIP